MIDYCACCGAYVPEGRQVCSECYAMPERIAMKNGKKPTRSQKQMIYDHGLMPENWLVVKDTSTEMEIVHRYSDITRRTIIKAHRGDDDE